MTNFLEEFHASMSAAGFEPVKGKIIADDKWHQASYMGEKTGKLSGAYTMKIVDANFAIGTFFTRKDPDKKHKWHSKSGEKITPEERKRIKRQILEQQRQKEIEEDARQRRISKRLTKVFDKLPKASDDHPYLVKKGITAHGARYRAKGNELILPLRGTDGNIWTVQRILADGSKFLFAGGRKKGSYFSFATSKNTLDLFLLCEGYATGASIREATGLPVIAAIDSGNLNPVLISLKAKYPAAQFLICADNDAFTLNAKKEPWNVGIEKAREAAAAIKLAWVCHPEFSEAAILAGRPTDFNDLHEASGIGEVAAQIQRVITGIPARDEAAASDQDLTGMDQHAGGGDPLPAPDDDGWEPDYEAEARNIDPLQGDFGMNYKVLGYNKGSYYYFPFRERQIVALSASAHTLPNLFRLDNLDNWMNKFGASDISEKKVVMYATNALMELAKLRGVFKEEDKVRGCGAWLDDGRKVLHCGDTLYVDGQLTKFDQIVSEFTYIAAAKLLRPSPDALSNKEAYALQKICESVTWENNLSGSLLAGWLVIAPICGALPFRPHVYITGEAESGKSTVLDRIIKPVLGKMSVNVDGGTTEPAIREIMEYDARPLVYDEAEKSPHMGAVLELARKASSGGMVKKFGQGMMKVRFCACFSAINPPVNKTADESRISFMVIKKNRRPTAMQEYEALLEQIDKHLTGDFSNRLITRTLQNMDVLFQNIATFQKAARMVIKGARASQVIGAMLAGSYLLHTTGAIDLEKAKEWISERDWTGHTIIDDDTDPVRLLQYLSSCLVRFTPQGGGNTRDMSIGDLIVMAAKGADDADKLLRYNGIAVKGDKVHIASRSHNLEKLLRDTDWNIKWTRMLENIEGAEKFKIFYFGVGVKTSGVSLPLKVFTEKEEPVAAPPPAVLFQPDPEEIPF